MGTRPGRSRPVTATTPSTNAAAAPLRRVAPPAFSSSRLVPVCRLATMPPNGAASRVPRPWDRSSQSRSPYVLRETSMLEALVTSDTSATMATATISGTSRSAIGHESREACTASSGDHAGRIPSVGRYQPAPGSERPSHFSASPPARHASSSAPGSASGDFTHRRSASSSATVPIALARRTPSLQPQAAARPSKRERAAGGHAQAAFDQQPARGGEEAGHHEVGHETQVVPEAQRAQAVEQGAGEHGGGGEHEHHGLDRRLPGRRRWPAPGGPWPR